MSLVKMEEYLDDLKWRNDKDMLKKTKEIDPDVFLMSVELRSYGNIKKKNLKMKNMLLTKNYMYFIS